MSLCQTFRELSYQTWIQLGKARQVKHQMLEESITDSLMVELKLRHPYDVFTTTFTRHEEGKNGADWEWWFVDSTGRKGIGFRVQAKIINFESNSFKQLHYIKNKGEPTEQSQTELLIKAAQSKNLIPLYCLYIQKNDLLNDLNPLLAWVKCFHYVYTLEHFGCSILSVENVKRLKKPIKKDHLGDVIDKIYPWHFLVCPPHSQNSNISLPKIVWEASKEFGLVEGSNIQVSEELPNEGIVPDYVLRLINTNSYDQINNRDLIDDKSFNDLHGIMIIKDNEEFD